MMRKSLFIFLALALVSVPVFLMAHAFTHFVEADAISTTNAKNAHIEDGHDIDVDDICLDCLALTGLGTILIILGFFLVDQTVRLLSIQLKIRRNPHKNYSLHCPRGPPLIPTIIS